MLFAQFTAFLLCGFSVFSGLLLATTQIRQREARTFGWVLIAAVIALQGSHAWLFTSRTLPFTGLYIALLYLIAPTFYCFVRGQLDPQVKPHSRWSLLHFLPVLFAGLLPEHVAMPLAFLVGGAYLVWLLRVLRQVRQQDTFFSHEILLLLLALGLGLFVFALGVSIPILGVPAFHTYYAIGIGSILFLLHWALLRNPDLPDTVSEAVQQTYVKSTLGQVNHHDKLAALEQLMLKQQLYRQPDLKLAGLAEQLGLSPHQLSELINTHRGMHFSRFLRHYRVEAAKAMLLSKPAMPVLDVGLHVGFSSQSTFYDAFRDITGTTPAKFRKINS